MSSLARTLLALAATALIAACAAEIDHCATVDSGDDGAFKRTVIDEHLNQTDSVIDLPPDQCPLPNREVGFDVTACDPFGPAPEITLLDNNTRVRIKCTWGNGQTCPQGLNLLVQQKCRWWVNDVK